MSYYHTESEITTVARLLDRSFQLATELQPHSTAIMSDPANTTRINTNEAKQFAATAEELVRSVVSDWMIFTDRKLAGLPATSCVDLLYYRSYGRDGRAMAVVDGQLIVSKTDSIFVEAAVFQDSNVGSGLGLGEVLWFGRSFLNHTPRVFYDTYDQADLRLAAGILTTFSAAEKIA